MLLTPDRDNITTVVAEAHEPAFRARQVMRWIYCNRARTFRRMSDVPKRLRSVLAERISLAPLRPAGEVSSRRGGTTRFLFELLDGERVESVFMPDRKRLTVCISSQVGCPLGCLFCATGQAGFKRDLAPSEIVFQVMEIEKLRSAPTNIVVMGMGEPFLNTDALIEALEIMTSKDGLGYSQKKIVVSTCGIVPGIRRLMQAAVHPNLALSLNSPFEEERRKLMPGTARYSLSETLQAAAEYASATNRKLSLEYVLLGGANSSPRHAAAVAALAKESLANVNLIAYNNTPGASFKSPSSEEVNRFRDEIRRHGARVTVRYKRGRDIGAGCGQLRGCADATQQDQVSRP